MKQKEITKDNTKDGNGKGQKILAAVYLVSAHLSDSDPIKQGLRSTAVQLVTQTFSRPSLGVHGILGHSQSTSHSTSDTQSSFLILQELLNAAVLARLITEKNASIIILEARYFARSIDNSQYEVEQDTTVEALFAVDQQALQTSHNQSYSQARNSYSQTHNRSHSQHSAKQPAQSLSQSFHAPSDTSSYASPQASFNTRDGSRSEIILSFIEQQQSASIKDIVTLFPDVSEKTVQRELIALLQAGKISKKGEKRWSVYMAVSAVV